jgi:hypothetical protein
MAEVVPSEDDVKHGIKYGFQVSLASSDFPGSISGGREENTTWLYKTEPARNAWSPRNLLRKPAFVLRDGEAREVLRIRRCKRIPPCFEIAQNGAVVGTIRRLGIVSYRIDLVGGPRWLFRMPIFTHCFYARSTLDTRVWIQVFSSEMNWIALVQSQADDLRLVASLAFIHRERCAYT